MMVNLATANTGGPTRGVSRGVRNVTTHTGARRRTDSAMQGISRDERPGRPADAGWRVRLYKGGIYVANRHFRDAAYGSRDGSLYAAQRFRDDKAREFGIRRREGQSSFLSKIRVDAGLSQGTLASWLHVSTPLIARWEKQGAPVAAIRLVTALIAGRVTPSVEMPTPDLNRVRSLLGLRQDEMADKFGRGYNAYGEWERGKRRIPGWVNVYIDSIAKGWDEKGANLSAEESNPPPIPDS